MNPYSGSASSGTPVAGVPSAVHWPGPSALQRAWLAELGLDKRLFMRPSDPSGSASAVPVPDTLKAPESHRGGAAQALQLLVRNRSFSAHPDPSAKQADPVRAVTAASVQPEAAKVAAVPEKQPAAAVPEPDLPTALNDLALHAAGCTRCGLHQSRGKVVFGEGQDQPDWLIIGEAPDASDDRAGRPFQGKAGQLLDAMLAAVGLDRSRRIYLTHLVKCRPLGNRPPESEAIDACSLFLKAQINALRPRGILALGQVAAAMLTGTSESIDVLRDRALMYSPVEGQDIPLVVTYHPAALLLRPQLKPLAWRDLQALRP